MTMIETPMPTCGNRDCTLSGCQPTAPLEAPTAPAEAPPALPALTVLPTRDGATGAADGAAFLTAACRVYDWRDMPPATVSDILAAIRERVATDWEAARNLARTMRAYGRDQSNEMRQFGPRFREMIAEGELIHAAWFEAPIVPSDWPVDALDMIGRPTDAARVLTYRTAPESPTALAYGASVRDMVAAWCEVRDILTNDCEALAEALAEAATDNGWCPTYDRLVSDLNGWCPPHVGTPFHRAEPARTYWHVNGTVTVTFNVSTSVGATDSDEALSGADFSDEVYELVRALDNAGVSHDLSRYASVDIDDADDSGDSCD